MNAPKESDTQSPNGRALLERFGENVRLARKAAEMSQVKLAEATGIKREYVSAIEGGHRNPSIALLGRIADALKIDPADLLRKGD